MDLFAKADADAPARLGRIRQSGRNRQSGRRGRRLRQNVPALARARRRGAGGAEAEGKASHLEEGGSRQRPRRLAEKLVLEIGAVGGAVDEKPTALEALERRVVSRDIDVFENDVALRVAADADDFLLGKGAVLARARRGDDLDAHHFAPEVW